jgi:hypothetical protein
MFEGRDIAVHPLDLDRAPDSSVVVTFTRKTASLQGRVRVPSEQDAERISVVIFPSDPKLWSQYGERPHTIQTVRCDQHGQYRVPDLPPMRYRAVAVFAETLANLNAPDFFVRLSRMSSEVEIGAGQTRVLDLAPPEGNR